MNFAFPHAYASARALEIVSLTITAVCLVCFCAVFTILYRNYCKHAIKDVDEGKDDVELLELAAKEEKQSKKKGKKALKITLNVFSWALFLAVAAGFSLSLASRITGNNMAFGDTSYIVIATGSMESAHPSNVYLEENHLEDRIHAYDMVEIKKASSPEEIELYDIIAFKAKDGRTIVHRVVKLLPDGGFLTKGDANAALDSLSLYGEALPYDQVVGIYTGHRVPIIGLFVIFLQSNAGIITVVSIIYCMLMFDHYHGKCDKAIAERTELLKKTLAGPLEKEGGEEASARFSEELTYRGETYVFEEGEYQPGASPRLGRIPEEKRDSSATGFNPATSIEAETPRDTTLRENSLEDHL